MILKQWSRIVSSKAESVRKATYLHAPPPPVAITPLYPGHQHSASCACQTSTFGSIVSLCRWVPRQQFGSSLLPTPLVVLLRFILPAASLKLQCSHVPRQQEAANPDERATAVGARFSSSYLRPRRLRRESSMENAFAHLGFRVSASDFFHEVTTTAKYDSWRVVSVTWVKALASHMSHEFIQFIAEDTDTGQRTRLIADRQETGDWVSITPNPNDPVEMSETFRGLGSGLWSKSTPYKDRHTLPLPLISINFDGSHAADDSRPTLRSMAELVVDISGRCKEYNPLREHCWWFSEAIIDGIRSSFPSAILEEWEWHRYRYSFVICNRWIRRRVLEAAARSFEERCLKEFAY